MIQVIPQMRWSVPGENFACAPYRCYPKKPAYSFPLPKKAIYIIFILLINRPWRIAPVGAFFYGGCLQENSLLSIEKPARYMGDEIGSVRKEQAEVRFVLAFPDVYEVGMSHLGLQILYSVLNDVEWIAAERVYAPWPDMEDLLRGAARPLATLESSTPLASSDILGFTLQHELSYTNILNMLQLSGIPLLAEERKTGYPLVLGGGPCALNPEPLADFFDAFLLGDGEEAIIEIAAAYRSWKAENRPKRELLERLSLIDGVYIPSFFDVRYEENGCIAEIIPWRNGYERVKRRIAADLEKAPYPTRPVIPFLKTVHDRVSMEIARGCTCGCRFCQAGYIYRPVRERTPEQILETIDSTLKNSGYDEISLLSLSTADYGCIAPLLRSLMERYTKERVAVSLPSLRVGTITREMVDEIKKVRKTGFTLAPEAGSERLRRVINKGITEEDLLRNAFEIYSSGWRLIKLYFMIGLPSETMEDVAGIVELSARVKREGKRAGGGGDVNVSVGSFVPKPHTPFQWEEQIKYEDILEKQHFLRGELKKKRLNFKWQDAPLSVLEGVFARGDRRLGAVLVKARELGCRFDSWGEHFDFGKWRDAFASAGIDPLFYHRARGFDEILPWDHLDSGVTKKFLYHEWEKSRSGERTEDCRSGKCSDCGVCDFRIIKMRLCEQRPESPVAPPAPIEADSDVSSAEGSERIRIRFTKVGPMRLLSHLEMLNMFSRAVKRAGIPIRYSAGFHPHPKFSFATALSVGVESLAEYLDMEIEAGFGAPRVREMLNRTLPEGMEVLESFEIPLRADSLSTIMDKVRYRVTLPPGSVHALPALAEAFLALETYVHLREKQSKIVEIDLRRELFELHASETVLDMVVGRGKPIEFAAAITGLTEKTFSAAKIEKLEVIFRPGEKNDSAV
jgi:radical SAM family uncharacterized protein/radical SAM-linked protein